MTDRICKLCEKKADPQTRRLHSYVVDVPRYVDVCESCSYLIYSTERAERERFVDAIWRDSRDEAGK